MQIKKNIDYLLEILSHRLLLTMVLIAGNTFAYSQQITDYDRIRMEIDSIINTPYFTKVYKTKVVRRRRRRHTVKYAVEVQRTFDIGCCIYDLKGDSVLYEYNASQMMTPASTQKLYVAATMLTNKDAKYAFKTSLVSEGEQMTDTLGRIYWDGDICIKYENDPSFSSRDAEELAKNLLTLGFDSINGKILMCVSDKNRKGTETGSRWAKAIANQLKDEGIRFTDSQPWGIKSDGYVRGDVENPYVRRFDDVKVETEQKVVPPKRERILAVKSTPLSDVLTRMLKNSNNSYAESVLVNVLDDDSSWSYDNCRMKVSDLVSRIRQHYHREDAKVNGITDYYNIIDGSGLSYSNKTTAQSQIDLLRYIYHNKRIYPVVYEALPIAGIDGTLSKRMRNSNSYESVRAKTGTLSNVYTLSGYAQMNNGNPVAFSILINKCYDSSFSRGLQDNICDIITRDYSKSEDIQQDSAMSDISMDSSTTEKSE